jgi:calmodulin
MKTLYNVLDMVLTQIPPPPFVYLFTFINTLVQSLTERQVKEFQDAFSFFDQDQDGRVGVEDLQKTFASLAMNKTMAEIKDMINECDTTRSGYIEFSQFVSILSAKLRDTDSEEMLRDAFQSWDTEKSGFVKAEDLKHALTTHGSPFTDKEWKSMLSEIQARESGMFDYEAFIAVLMNKPKK